MIPFVIFLLAILFTSNIIAGYTVGKTSTKLRYGIIIGVTNSLLGSFAIYVISYLYSPFYGQSLYTMFEKLLNLGLVSTPSVYDIVVSWIRASLGLLASGGGGGAIGQLLSLKFRGERHG
jgi:cytochrome c oxidase assembly factor CtaG